MTSHHMTWFLNDGARYPEIVENMSFFLLILDVYLGHGIFHLAAVLIFSKWFLG